MDRNQFTGLILMFALLAAYFFFFSPEAPPPVAENEPDRYESSDSLVVSSNTPNTLERDSVNTIIDSLITAENAEKYGVFAFASNSIEEVKTITTDELEITFTNQGGKIKSVTLFNERDYLGNPLKIMSSEKSSYNYFLVYNEKKLDVSNFSFIPSIKEHGDSTILDYSLKTESFQLTHSFIIPKSGYQIGHTIKTFGLNGIVDPVDIDFVWNHKLLRSENNLEDSRFNSNVRYYLNEGEYDQLKERSTELEEERINSQIKWVSFKQKFFTTALIANTGFKEGYVNGTVDFTDTTSVKNLAAQLVIPYSEFINGFNATFYFGPNKYDILKKVAPDFEENLDMGWGPLPLVNKFLIIPIFHFLEKHLTNYGLIIFIIVIVIRLILSPLTYKSHMSMAKMRVMKPELDELKSKHKDDMQKAQQEQMKLYQKVGINPLSGCIPMLLQMPILFSLFFFFPNAVELRQESFLWATDLSTYDSIINLPFNIPFYGNHVSLFTLLMTVSTLLITASNSQMTTVEGPMKTMQYIMPIMFLFVLNSYASGLTFYYFVSNMATFGQTVLFRKIVDEEKIKKVLDENRKKSGTKKKSKFQTRLEEAMKASQEAQKQKQKKGKKK